MLSMVMMMETELFIDDPSGLYRNQETFHWAASSCLELKSPMKNGDGGSTT